MMLVMTTTGVFDGCHSDLIDATWRKLNKFVPQLQAELNPTVPSMSSHPTMPSGTSQEQLDTQPDQPQAPVNVEVTTATKEKTMAAERKPNNGNYLSFANHFSMLSL